VGLDIFYYEGKEVTVSLSLIKVLKSLFNK